MANDSVNEAHPERILQQIRAGDRRFLQSLYQKYRDEFLLWASKNYQCDNDQAAEVYQQCFITLYYNVKEGKLKALRSSLKTYLFAIGKNLLRDQFKVARRRQQILEISVDTSGIDNSILDKYERSNMKEVVRKLLQQIGEPCKTVLELFYFREFALDAIARHMQYKSQQIAAKRKFICLRQMRTLMLEAQQRGEI